MVINFCLYFLGLETGMNYVDIIFTRNITIQENRQDYCSFCTTNLRKGKFIVQNVGQNKSQFNKVKNVLL